MDKEEEDEVGEVRGRKKQRKEEGGGEKGGKEERGGEEGLEGREASSVTETGIGEVGQREKQMPRLRRPISHGITHHPQLPTEGGQGGRRQADFSTGT